MSKQDAIDKADEILYKAWDRADNARNNNIRDEVCDRAQDEAYEAYEAWIKARDKAYAADEAYAEAYEAQKVYQATLDKIERGEYD